MKKITLALALLLLQACKHPLIIIGEGDIVDTNNSGFGCTLVQFRAQDVACTENEVGDEDYIVNYEARPRPGWQFVRWEGDCGDNSVAPRCAFNAPTIFTRWWNENLPDTDSPALTAVFEPEHHYLGEGTQVAGDLVAGAIDIYDLSFSQPGKLDLYSSGNTDVRADLLLNGELLVRNDDHSLNDLNFRIEYLAGASGFYELEVKGYDENISGPYLVMFEFTPHTDTVEYEMYCLALNYVERSPFIQEWCTHALNYSPPGGGDSNPPIGSGGDHYPPIGSGYSSGTFLAPLDPVMRDFYVRWEKRFGAGTSGSEAGSS